jgi:hypothetical protein
MVQLRVRLLLEAKEFAEAILGKDNIASLAKQLDLMKSKLQAFLPLL